jgi:hypothetical protein
MNLEANVSPGGGMPTTTNRTKWPVTGGAVAVQPGWFQGHASAYFYINLGLGTEIKNASFPMVPVFQIAGPTRDPYPGTFCLPQVPLPANLTVKIGDNATIQIIETAVHGAALFNVSSLDIDRGNLADETQCVDITFSDPSEVEEVTPENCYNSTDISFGQVYTAPNQNDASSLLRRHNQLALIPLLLGAAFAMA